MAKKEILERGRENIVCESVAVKVAIASLHYYLLKGSSIKDILFDPQQSLSFNGNTGVYLQYTLARTCSLLNKDKAQAICDKKNFDTNLLIQDEEWEIIKILDHIQIVITRCACEYSPHLLANKLYELAKKFNKYYHETPILTAENEELLVIRCVLTQAVKVCLSVGFYLLNMPTLDKM